MATIRSANYSRSVYINSKSLQRTFCGFFSIFRTPIERGDAGEAEFSRKEDVVPLSRALEPIVENFEWKGETKTRRTIYQ
jgi:hypothetical protein